MTSAAAIPTPPDAFARLASGFTACLFGYFAHCPFLHAAEVVPFNTQTLNPFVQIYGLPSLDLPRDSMRPSKSRASDANSANQQGYIQLSQEFANSYKLESNPDEGLVIDGEVWRSRLTLGYQWSERWSSRLEIPYVELREGFLDPLIDNWHEWFNLPDGDRDLRPESALRYYYRSGAQIRLDRLEASQGLGDIRLNLQYALPIAELDGQITGEVKLPTGTAADLTGSGATDYSLGMLLRDSHTLADWNLSWFGGGAISHLGRTDLDFDGRQNNWVWTTRFGMGWTPSPTWQLKAQLDHHTSVYRSSLTPLGENGVQLTAGFSWFPSQQWQWDLAISEDLNPTVTPDFTLLIATSVRY